jgi:hypothetical protein
VKVAAETPEPLPAYVAPAVLRNPDTLTRTEPGRGPAMTWPKLKPVAASVKLWADAQALAVKRIAAAAMRERERELGIVVLVCFRGKRVRRRLPPDGVAND